MGLNICVLLFVGLFVHSINAQCTQLETDNMKACLQQASQGTNANGLQMVTLGSESGPCLQQAGCNGAQSGTGFGGVFSQFLGGGGQPQPQQQPNNGNDEQCYNAVTKQARQHFGTCVKNKSPNFNQNDAHFGSERHHGQQTNQGQQSNVMQQLNQKCNNDKIKVRKVQACMLNTPAGQQQYDAIVQKGCQCKQQVSQKCQQQLEQHRQAACQCAKETTPMYDNFEQQNEPMCQGQAIEPDGMMAIFQKMDINRDPCGSQG